LLSCARSVEWENELRCQKYNKKASSYFYIFNLLKSRYLAVFFLIWWGCYCRDFQFDHWLRHAVAQCVQFCVRETMPTRLIKGRSHAIHLFAVSWKSNDLGVCALRQDSLQMFALLDDL
jgi:hypothetical protein